MKKVCLILSAGVSIEFGSPSTESLTNIIENKLEKDPVIQNADAFHLYRLIKKTLHELLIKPGNVHFEHIYHCIHEMVKFSEEVSTEAFDEFRFILRPFLCVKNEKRDLLQQDQHGINLNYS